MIIFIYVISSLPLLFPCMFVYPIKIGFLPIGPVTCHSKLWIDLPNGECWQVFVTNHVLGRENHFGLNSTLVNSISL